VSALSVNRKGEAMPMSERQALDIALHALKLINILAEGGEGALRVRVNDGYSADADAVEVIHEMTGSVIGVLARAGYEETPRPS
jgi:hypothetical protein